MKVCSVCGITENETRIIKSKQNGFLCRKHYLQIYKKGSVYTTIYDNKPSLEIQDDIALLLCYDKNATLCGKAIIDKHNLPKIEGYTWYMFCEGCMCKRKEDGKKIFLHRLLLNVPDDKVIDHINGNRLDNREKNLRICSQKENSRNRKYKSSRVYPGVKLVPSGRYQVSIGVDYKGIYLGTFDTVEEAIKIKKEAEEKYFGDFRYSFGHEK